MAQARWWLAVLLSLALTWPRAADCTVQLQPITKLAGWQAHGTWVFNGPRTIAAGSAVQRDEVYILQRREGSWLLADVITPPDAQLASIIPGSVSLSDDGRLLAVAASSTRGRHQNTSDARFVTLGYLYKVVAQPSSPHAFRYQLVQQLTVPLHTGDPHNTSKDSGRNSGTGRPWQTNASITLAADGSTLLACWTGQTMHSAAAAGLAAPALTTSGGAAIVTLRGAGEISDIAQLTPPGSKRFGEACSLSSDGRTALILDGGRGALVYQHEAHTARGTHAAYRAVGWLPGGPAQHTYRVAAAGLSSLGQQAALLVTAGTQLATAAAGAGARVQASLRVFGADGYGHWSGGCEVLLGVQEFQEGEVKLEAVPGGVHVWVSINGQLRVFDVGMEGSQVTHCPSHPVVTSVVHSMAAAGLTLASAAQPARVQQQGKSSGVRTGQLKVDGSDVVFVAVE